MSPEDKQYFEGNFSAIRREVDTIKRGVYGDEENDVPGLIDHQKEHHKRIKDLEDTKKKALWYGGGILITLNAVYHFFKEKLIG